MKSGSGELPVPARAKVLVTGEDGADSRRRSEGSGVSEYRGVDKCELSRSYWYGTWWAYAGGALDGETMV